MSETPSAQNPFPGPRPFSLEEDKLFFGRQSESRDLFSLVTANQVVLLYAQSGAGKTSLLNAGLQPQLRAKGFHVLPTARLGSVLPRRPSNIDNIFVSNALTCWAKPETDPARLTGQTLAEFLGCVRQGGSGVEIAPIVAIFDQFEEIFTAHLDHWPEREPFFEQLQEALERDRLLRVLLAIREDFIAQLDPYASLLAGGLRTRFRLERLSAEAALEAVEGPFLHSGVRFTEGIAEELVSQFLKERVQVPDGSVIEIAGQYVEPVQLQVVCRKLWRPGQLEIGAADLRSFGSIDDVLSHFYDEVVAAAVASGADEYNLRAWCETELITPLGTRGFVLSDRGGARGIPSLVLKVLEEKHLIRPEPRAGASWYELTHDRFIDPIRASNRRYLKWVQAWERRIRRWEEAILREINSAHTLWQGGKQDEALECNRRCLARIKRRKLTGELIYADALRQRGEFLRLRREYEPALRSLDLALSIYGACNEMAPVVEVLASIALVRNAREEYDEEAEVYSRILSTRLDTLDRRMLFAQRGNAYWYGGKHAKAIADYNRLLRPESRDFSLLMARGQIYAEAGQAEKAAEDLTRALVIARSQRLDARAAAYVRSGLGLACAQLGQFPKALREFRNSLRAAPRNAWAYFNRALCYERLGNIRRAREDFAAALRMRHPPLNPWKRKVARCKLNCKPETVPR